MESDSFDLKGVPTVLSAKHSEAGRIADLIECRAPLCLPVEEAEVRSRIDTYGVVKNKDELLATAAVYPLGPSRWELRSVAVAPGWEKKGMGAQVVRWAMGRAQAANKTLCCVTYNADFFKRLGFKEIPPMLVPPKAKRAEFPVEGNRTTMAWMAGEHALERRFENELRATA